MFGYVRPARDALQEDALARYQAVYCGLCRTLGKRYGWAARLTLNYDFTFLALLLCYPDPSTEPCAARCPAHPLKKRPMCQGTAGLDAAADESMVLTWHKLRDSVQDNAFFHGLPARTAAFFLKGAYRKAAARRPVFDRAVRDCLAELAALEAAGTASIDRTADTFARILRAAAVPTEDHDADRAAAQLLYHLGRWIYLIDALDDLQQDMAAGRFNPIAARFGAEVDRDWLRTTLHHSRAIACSAFDLLPSGSDRAIVENILMRGLPAVEELVFRGEWKTKKRWKE